MIKLKKITGTLERLAPLSFQESYDNSGLQVGDPEMQISGILVAFDVTEEVVEEAVRLGFNLIISHHPVIFEGLKSLTGRTASERIVARSLREGIAIYSGHTNFDSIWGGVNSAMAGRMGLTNLKVLDPRKGLLKKLVVFVPSDRMEQVRQAMFEAGAGEVGAYDSCSFNLDGTGTFRGQEGTNPYVGIPGAMHREPETRVETIVPSHLINGVVQAMVTAHPYEEVAYDIYPLENSAPGVGMGMVGDLEDRMDEEVFLSFIKDRFGLSVIRHSGLLGKPVRRVSLCGGAGSFLIGRAIASGADVFITADIKYHQFFDAEGQIVLMDIGHFESEQFIREIFYDLLMKNFPKFAIRLSETDTNPIKYY